MSDIFISYAREDLERARRLAGALETRGWSVWWDRRIVAGQTFDQAIERELESARSVVVLWSRDSIESEWTKNEATAAAERNVLVPALLDDVRIPLEFRRKQTANLIGWEGEPSHDGFQALCEGIAGRIGAPSVGGARQVLPPLPPPRRWPIPAGWRTGAAAAGAVAITAGALWWSGGGDQPEDPTRGEPVKPPAANVAAPTATGTSGLDVATPTVRSGPLPDANGIDNPTPLSPGAVHKLTLEKNEDYYFRLSPPAGAVRIVQDMRVAAGESSNLQSELSILDEHGAVVQANALRVSEYDVAFRKTVVVSLKPPGRASLRLLNKGVPAEFWIAVLAPEAPSFIPFFGSLVPRPMSPAQDASGSLDRGEDAYYASRLTPGKYRITADFTAVPRVVSNILGAVTLLDADGGNEQPVVRFSEYDTTNRQVGEFSVKKDEPRILRIHNRGGTVSYALKIAKIE